MKRLQIIGLLCLALALSGCVHSGEVSGTLPPLPADLKQCLRGAGVSVPDFGGEALNVIANSVTWYESGGNTIVQADVNGNATADVMFVLTGVNHNLTASDFIL